MPRNKKDGARVIKCPLDKILKPEIVSIIRDIVPVYNRITISATLFLNLHIRQLVESRASPTEFAQFFQANKLVKYFMAVTSSNTGAGDLHTAFGTNFPSVIREDRPKAFSQVCMYICRNLEAIATTNVWYHMKKRVCTVVKKTFGTPRDEWLQMSDEEKKNHRIHLKQVKVDVLSLEGDAFISPEQYHDWISNIRSEMRVTHVTRQLLADTRGIDVDDPNVPGMVYYMKAKPYEFIYAIATLSSRRNALNGGGYALYPIRSSMVPKYLHLDELILADISPGIARRSANTAAGKKRTVDGSELSNKDKLIARRMIVFKHVMTPKSFNKWENKLGWSVDTDGYGCSLHIKKEIHERPPSESPSIHNGLFKIDEFKDKFSERYPINDLSIVGIDPGKREIVAAVDSTDYTSKYTFRKTHQDHLTGTVRHRKAMEHAKPQSVFETEQDLATTSKKVVPVERFMDYATKLATSISSSSGFYEQGVYRKHKWKRHLRLQKAYSGIANNLKMVSCHPHKPIVLAYGSWGMSTTGLPFKGLPPTIGIGMIRYLARFFPVVITPEYYTSTICPCCDSNVTRCTHIEQQRSSPFFENGRLKDIRGLKHCPGCNTYFNRDNMGAWNIARNFTNMYQGMAPIRVRNAAQAVEQELTNRTEID